MDSYDALPYDSNPFPDATPAALGALARLHGLDPVPPSRARVLELGCAAGGHLIPLAVHHPEAEFLGLDLSPVQVAAGNRLIAALGIANCHLEQADVGTCTVAPGAYDYVIAHGLYSWVPEPVRRAILPLCRRALSPRGIAYVSYNTLPGWHQRRVLRDLLQWRLRGEYDPQTRARRAAQWVTRLAAVAADSPTPLAAELQRLDGRPLSYLAHEYLEDHNQAFLLRDFVIDAGAAGLTYLCDTELRASLPWAYGEEVAALAAEQADRVEAEQLLDFLANRGFRQSLLTRNDHPPGPLDPGALQALWLAAPLEPPARVDLRRANAQPFTAPDGAQVEVHHPLAKAALALLDEAYPAARPYPELLAAAAARVAAAGGARFAGETDTALGELFELAAGQAISLRPEPAPATGRATASHPTATPLARLQAEQGWDEVATVHHRGIRLDAFARAVLVRLDGSRDREALAQDVLELFHPGGPLAPLAGNREARQRLPAQVRGNLDRLLGLFARNGLLE